MLAAKDTARGRRPAVVEGLVVDAGYVGSITFCMKRFLNGNGAP